MSNGDQCCKLEAIVTVDSKGQLLLPKDLREKANLKPNTKLALLTIEKENIVQCILMVKAEDLSGTVDNAISLIPKKNTK